MIHDLKIQPSTLDAVLDGRKTFEIGAEDGGYDVGDHLKLREWSEEQERYLGRELLVEITDLSDLGDGRVVLAIATVPPSTEGPVS